MIQTDLKAPTLQDVFEARKLIHKYLNPTPFHHYPLLDKLLNAKVYVKHENHLPVGAFKVRGGVYLVSKLSQQQKDTGIIGASTGNHAQSLAYGAMLFGAKCIIAMPENANPLKVASLRSMGAEVFFHGKDFDEARKKVEEMAKLKGYRYISNGDEPDLVAGVGTYTLEMLEQQPDTEVIIVPVGGGSGAAANCIVAKALNPDIKVIGVQAEKAPAAYLTWKDRQYTEASMETFAEGLATRAPFMFPQKILWEMLDDFITVSEDEILKAIPLFFEKTRNLPEGAAASSLACALKIKERLKGKKVGLVMTGGNISLTNLRRALDRYESL